MGHVLLEQVGNAELSKEFQATVRNAIGKPDVAMDLTPRYSIEIRDVVELVKIFVTKPTKDLRK